GEDGGSPGGRRRGPARRHHSPDRGGQFTVLHRRVGLSAVKGRVDLPGAASPWPQPSGNEPSVAPAFVTGPASPGDEPAGRLAAWPGRLISAARSVAEALK